MVPDPTPKRPAGKDSPRDRGRLPLGFKLEGGRRVEDEDAAALIREARRLHAEGCSERKTLKAVTEKRLRSRQGRRLTPMGLWRILVDV